MRINLRKLYDHVAAWFALLGTGMKNFASQALEISGSLLSFVRTVEGNPTAAAILAAILPAKIAAAIPQAESVLVQAIATLTGLTDKDKKNDKKVIEEFIKWLQVQPPLVQNAIAQKLAAVILSLLDGGGDKENVYQSIIDALLHGKKYSLPA